MPVQILPKTEAHRRWCSTCERLLDVSFSIIGASTTHYHDSIEKNRIAHCRGGSLQPSKFSLDQGSNKSMEPVVNRASDENVENMKEPLLNCADPESQRHTRIVLQAAIQSSHTPAIELLAGFGSCLILPRDILRCPPKEILYDAARVLFCLTMKEERCAALAT